MHFVHEKVVVGHVLILVLVILLRCIEQSDQIFGSKL